jgi:hypothetical protein
MDVDMGLRFEAEGVNGYRLQAWLDDRPSPGPAGDWKQLRILHSADNGHSWEELPLRLAVTSRITQLYFSSHPHWPPTWLVRIGLNNGNAWFEYKDEWPEWRTTFKPCLWRAEYMPILRHWKIKRIKQLDREHEA